MSAPLVSALILTWFESVEMSSIERVLLSVENALASGTAETLRCVLVWLFGWKAAIFQAMWTDSVKQQLPSTVQL